jgi:hypothetical protein
MKIKTLALGASITVAVVASAAPAFAQFGLANALLRNSSNANSAASAATAAANLAASAAPITAVSAPAPELLASPKAIEGTTGKFMSPFTSDGVTAGWVTKAMSVKASGAVGAMAGSAAGQYAANKAANQMASIVPIPGMSFLAQRAGKAAGEAAGRGMALQSIGGEAFLKSSTDLSFNTLQEMAIYMYVNHSTHPDYAKIVDATTTIYPDFKAAYGPALQTASLK